MHALAFMSDNRERESWDRRPRCVGSDKRPFSTVEATVMDVEKHTERDWSRTT